MRRLQERLSVETTIRIRFSVSVFLKKSPANREIFRIENTLKERGLLAGCLRATTRQTQALTTPAATPLAHF
jgi:hypothetical protein